MKMFRGLLLFQILLCSLHLKAVPEVIEKTPEQKAAEERPVSWEQKLIEGNIAISQWFDSAAQGLDLFLAGRQLTTRKNDTTIKLENSTNSQEGHSLTNSTGVGVLLRLPNFEQYWHLKFTNYNEQEDQRNLKNSYLRQTPREKNYGATVGVFRKLGNIRTSFQPRIELQDPLKVSQSLQFESVAQVRNYEINPKLEFYATPDKGTGIFQAINFNFQLSKEYTLTFVNQGDYQDKLHLYNVTNAVSLGRVYTDRTSISYNILFSSNNQPNYHLEGYNFSISCNQVLYKRILDFQIIPNVDFEKAVDFKRVLGITLNFNLYF
jgi:hypothetical protein